MLQSLRNVIKNKQIKGIVVGYPLDHDGNPVRHCRFVEDFLELLAKNGVLRNIPVTLVNEYDSSMQAKAKIFDRLKALSNSSSDADLLGLVGHGGATHTALPSTTTIAADAGTIAN